MPWHTAISMGCGATHWNSKVLFIRPPRANIMKNRTGILALTLLVALVLGAGPHVYTAIQKEPPFLFRMWFYGCESDTVL